MGRQFDSLLILMVAVCTVVTTGVTIHDANLGKQNPVANHIKSSIEAVITWFGQHSATPVTPAASPTSKESTDSQSSSTVNQASHAIQSLEQQIFGKQALLPTVGAVLP